MEWKIALVQHPMYLLIKEDSQCAERTPPWGAATIEDYIDRVRRNLQTLRTVPGIKVGFEWSGYELELLAEAAPEVLREMCDLAREGRVAFYNGTYAQPHLQTLGSESSYRQFERGAQVYRDLCGVQVLTYAHQEASVHDQVPQLMSAFGIRQAVIPGFSSTLGWLDGGELVLFGGQGLRFVHGHEFAWWTGLDGTQVPLYLRPAIRGDLRDVFAGEEMAGLLHIPPILVQTPDLIEVDQAWIERHSGADMVLLDEALADRLQRYPPRARARLSSNWSYIEGIRAEELSRSSRDAETAALRAEALDALAFSLLGKAPGPTDRLWKTILCSQHHDAHCFCAPELKGKAVGWLRGAREEADHKSVEAARAVAARVRINEREGIPVVVFSTTPHRHRAVVTHEVDIEHPRVVDADGGDIACETVTAGAASRGVRFLAEFEGMGYATFWIRKGGPRSTPERADGAVSFENPFYGATVRSDGTFESLTLKPSSQEIFARGTVAPNQLSAMDSTGLSPRRPAMAPRGDWQPPGRGPELAWEPTSPAHLTRSPLGLTLAAAGRMGAKVKAELGMSFYNDIPRIDLCWRLDFDEASVGTFYDDETKLRVQWPLAFDGEIRHDIAFGVVKEWEERSFFPASWVDVSDGRRGLAYFHTGTLKHWVKDRTLVNLFAWGEDTEAIGSRLWRHDWPKAFDQRLRGTHIIRSALFPHAGDWRAADVVGAARDFAAAPLVLGARPQSGNLPESLVALAIRNPSVAATAVMVRDGRVICRLYSYGTSDAPLEHDSAGFGAGQLHDLAGERIGFLRPFQIGLLDFGQA